MIRNSNRLRKNYCVRLTLRQSVPVGQEENNSDRVLKKQDSLPARPESAKIDSLPWDVPCPKQGCGFESEPRFTVSGGEARTNVRTFWHLLGGN
jgi:hypothetical protein